MLDILYAYRARAAGGVKNVHEIKLPDSKFFDAEVFRAAPSLEALGHPSHVGISTEGDSWLGAKDAIASAISASPTVDVFGLLPAAHDLYAFAEAHHPGFLEVWDKLIRALGLGDYKRIPKPAAFYGNKWIMRGDLYEEYRQLAVKAMDLMESDPELRDVALRDSSYRGPLDADALSDISGGRPYYTFHSFVMERLVCFWVALKGLEYKPLPPDAPELHSHVYIRSKKSTRLL